MQVNNLTTLYGYYQSAYAAVRAYSGDCFVMIAPRTWEEDTGPTSPSTPTPGSWQTFMTGSSYTKVLLDLHKCVTSLTSPLPGHFMRMHAKTQSAYAA